MFSCIAALSCATGVARAQWATLEIIPPLTGVVGGAPALFAVTPDGSRAVGFAETLSFQAEACLWTRGVGTVGLGDLDNSNPHDSRAYAISDDGSIIAGQGSNRVAGRTRAFRWTALTGMVELPLVPGRTQDSSSFSYGMTPDGGTIVGECGVLVSADTTEFRWTAEGGAVGLVLIGGWGISGDGAYMSGSGQGGHAWRWHVGDPQVEFIPIPPGAQTNHSGPISRDGTTVLGDAEFGTGSPFFGFRWTPTGGTIVFNQTLPDYPTSSSSAYGVSGDGSVVVGTLYNNAGLRSRAFIWDAQHGVRDLNQVLAQNYGMNLGAWILNQAYSISPDGRWIAGNAYHADLSDGSNIAWLVHLNDGCYANCDDSTGSPALNVADFTCFLQKFSTGDPYANCDNSTAPPVLNVADFTCFLQKYAAGCP
jgi:probable HAF family extracellular repeat protein